MMTNFVNCNSSQCSGQARAFYYQLYIIIRRFLFKQQCSDSKEVPDPSLGIEPRLPIRLMTLNNARRACRVCQLRSDLTVSGYI